MKTLLHTALFPAVVACLANGCVTANQCDVALEITAFGEDEPINDCTLLSIKRKGVDADGYWWVVEREKRSPGIAVSATVQRFDSGDRISQEGQMLYLIGPYVRGQMISYEYWLFRRGYQPESFMDTRLEMAKKRKKPASVSLEKIDYEDEYFNEHVLDGARTVAALSDILPRESESTRRLVLLALHQVRMVRTKTIEPRTREDAAELMEKLQAFLPETPGPVPVEG